VPGSFLREKLQIDRSAAGLQDGTTDLEDLTPSREFKGWRTISMASCPGYKE
jgi:hypothetical protein